jgi:hypothetical protein
MRPSPHVKGRRNNLSWFMRPSLLVMGKPKELKLVHAAASPPKELELVYAAFAPRHGHAERT